jgi:hypothetical protein
LPNGNNFRLLHDFEGQEQSTAAFGMAKNIRIIGKLVYRAVERQGTNFGVFNLSSQSCNKIVRVDYAIRAFMVEGNMGYWGGYTEMGVKLTIL